MCLRMPNIILGKIWYSTPESPEVYKLLICKTYVFIEIGEELRLP